MRWWFSCWVLSYSWTVACRFLFPWGFPCQRILKWVTISFSIVFSWPRVWTHVSCIAGRFFTTESSGKPLSLDYKINFRFLCTVMPKSQNLPMTTREPISDAKAREFLLPSSSWGSHRYWRSGYREEPRVLGYIACIGSVHGKKFLPRGTSDWSLSFEELCVGFWLVPIT